MSRKNGSKPWAHANPEMAKALSDLRSSGAAGAHHDARTKRRRTRESAKSAAVRDSFASA